MAAQYRKADSDPEGGRLRRHSRWVSVDPAPRSSPSPWYGRSCQQDACERLSGVKLPAWCPFTLTPRILCLS